MPLNSYITLCLIIPALQSLYAVTILVTYYIFKCYCVFTLLKDQLMHLFQHFYIHIKTPKRLLKMFHKSVIYK
jgi:hypothetical protein